VTSCSLTRTPALLRDGDDCLVFGICEAGEGEMRFGEDRARISAGSCTLSSTHRRGGFYSATGAISYSVRIEHWRSRTFCYQ
jgi:hypothetical protein